MQTVTTIDADCDLIWNEISNLSNWPVWNGAILNIKNTEIENRYKVRVRVLGWIHCIVSLDYEKKIFEYDFFGKGNREFGRLSLASDSHHTTVHYRVEH